MPTPKFPSPRPIGPSSVVIFGTAILMAVHYGDDHSWAFTCGTSDDPEDGRACTMREAFEHDPSIAGIADLEPGWCAWRESPTDSWQSCPLDGEADRADAR